jgi:hypothetical protein
MPVHRVTRMLLVVGGGGNPLGFLVGFSAFFQTGLNGQVLCWHDLSFCSLHFVG